MFLRSFSLLNLLIIALNTAAVTAVNTPDNFWQDTNFTDTAFVNSPDMERQFVEFLRTVEQTDNKSSAFGNLINKASHSPQSFSRICDLAEAHLFNESSELYNDNTYLIFLESILSNVNAPLEYIVRADFYASELKKNLPGTIASDFRFIMSDGKNSTLYKTVLQGELLIMFYDPDCEHCDEAIHILKNNADFDNRKLTVMAVCISGDNRQWLASLNQMPPQWLCAYPTTDMDDIYFLKTSPAFYLLSKDKTVIRRNITLTEIRNRYIR